MPPRQWRLVLCCGLLVLVLSACNAANQIFTTLTPAPTNTRVRPPTITPDPAATPPLPNRTKGNPHAKVTLVIYSDFQCRFCRDYALGSEIRVMNDYVDTNKISYTYKYFPVVDEGRIGESHWAAYAAECANEQGKFWEYKNKLFIEWRGENVGAFTRDNLKLFAADLRLDTAAFNTCLDTDRYATLVLDHLTEALQLRLPGTPLFMLNGRKMDIRTLDYGEFWKPIEEELKRYQ